MATMAIKSISNHHLQHMEMVGEIGSTEMEVLFVARIRLKLGFSRKVMTQHVGIIVEL